MANYSKLQFFADMAKALSWPLVIVIALWIFSSELSNLIKRLHTFKTGQTMAVFQTKPDEPTATRPTDITSPYLSMNFRPTDAGKKLCMERARKALEAGGFSEIRQKDSGLVWGYYESYVGAVICRFENELAVFVISGPDFQIAEKKRIEVESAFSE